MDQIVGMAQLYFMPHPLLEIVQRLMAHPVDLFLSRYVGMGIHSKVNDKEYWEKKTKDWDFFECLDGFTSQ